MNGSSISVADFSIVDRSLFPAGQAALAIDGYIQWKNGTVYYSPSLGPCPYKPLIASEIDQLIVRNTYPCPFPIGGDQMWSATIVFKTAAHFTAIIENLDQLG